LFKQADLEYCVKLAELSVAKEIVCKYKCPELEESSACTKIAQVQK